LTGGTPSSLSNEKGSSVIEGRPVLIDTLLRNGRKLTRETIELAIERTELVDAVERADWTEKRRRLAGIVEAGA